LENPISVQSLLKKYSQETLKKISTELIEAYRSRDHKTLYYYAEKLHINTGECEASMSMLFKKLIFAYHPDRIIHFHRRIMDLHQKGEIESLKLLKDNRIKKADRYERPPEEEVYSYQWTGSDDFNDADEYLDGAWTGMYEQEEYGFIEAVKNLMYGNLFTDFLPKDLYYLDGELNLAEEGIEDLTGIEYCRNITELNLERNRIVHLAQIAELENLTSLYLSHNSIEDIDDLQGLTRLRTLDLSFNEIDDPSILDSLPNLEYVNLIGNKGIRTGTLKRLSERCIVLF